MEKNKKHPCPMLLFIWESPNGSTPKTRSRKCSPSEHQQVACIGKELGPRSPKKKRGNHRKWTVFLGVIPFLIPSHSIQPSPTWFLSFGIPQKLDSTTTRNGPSLPIAPWCPVFGNPQPVQNTNSLAIPCLSHRTGSYPWNHPISTSPKLGPPDLRG